MQMAVTTGKPEQAAAAVAETRKPRNRGNAKGPLLQEAEKAANPEEPQQMPGFGRRWNMPPPDAVPYKYDEADVPTGTNTAFTNSLRNAKKILSKVLRTNHRWYWDDIVGIPDKDEDARIHSAISSTVSLRGDRGEDVIEGFFADRGFLLKAYADFLKTTLTDSEYLVLCEQLRGTTRTLTGRFFESNKTLTDLIGTANSPGQGIWHTPQHSYKAREVSLLSELYREIEAIKYAERSQQLGRDLSNFLLGAQGSLVRWFGYHTNYAQMREEGEKFTIPSNELQTTKVSFGVLSVLRQHIGNMRSLANYFDILKGQNNQIIDTVFTLSTMELYPRAQNRQLFVTVPDTFTDIHSHPFQMQYNQMVSAMELLCYFVAELRKDLKVVHHPEPLADI